MTVTASNSGGSASVSFKLSVVAVAPAVVTAPKLTGTGKIGAAVSVDAGSWSGKPAPTTALQWRRDGADIAGATGGELHAGGGGRPDRSSRCRVTATNVAGSAVATTAALAVTRVAPVASGTLADVELVQGAAAGSVAAAAAFTGAGLSYAVSGGGATIDAATGVVQPADRDAGLGGDGDGDRQQLRRQRLGELQAQRGGGGAGGGDGAEAHRHRQDRRGGQRRCRELERQAGADASRCNGAATARTSPARPAASYTPVAADDRTAAQLPGDRDQHRGQCRGDHRGAAGDPGGAGGERHAGGRRARSRARPPAASRRRRPSPAPGCAYAVSGGGATIDAATGVVRLPTADAGPAAR